MPLLYDLLEQRLQYAASSPGTGGIGSPFSELHGQRLPVFEVTNVARLMLSKNRPVNTTIPTDEEGGATSMTFKPRDDFPNVAPPYDHYWMEFQIPKDVRLGAYSRVDRVGVSCHWPSRNELRLCVWLDGLSSRLEPIGGWTLHVDDQGNVSDCQLVCTFFTKWAALRFGDLAHPTQTTAAPTTDPYDPYPPYTMDEILEAAERGDMTLFNRMNRPFDARSVRELIDADNWTEILEWLRDYRCKITTDDLRRVISDMTFTEQERERLVETMSELEAHHLARYTELADEVDEIRLRAADVKSIWLGWAVLSTVLYANSLLSRRNVETEEVQPPAALVKKHRKKHGHGLTIYKTLTIRPSSKGTAPGTRFSLGGGATALHLVRGHFKHFTAERPLLGQHVGTYYWQATVRGASEHGTVVKDYKIDP